MQHLLPLAAAAVATLGVSTVASAQWQQVNRVFLSDVFNANSQFGDNPSAIAFDGTTAFVGGFNNSGGAKNIGVVAVTDLFGTPGTATVLDLPATTFSAVAGRGINQASFDPATNSLLVAYDSGAEATSFVSRHTTTDGAVVWQTLSPNTRRPFATAADPLAPGGDPSLAAFFSQGSGRRLALDIDDGSLVYSSGSPSPGGGILFSGTVGTAFRYADFDAAGNIYYATPNGIGLATRSGVNTFAGDTSTLVLASGGANNIGRAVVVLDGAGPNGEDLLAVALRDSSTATPSAGSGFAVNDTRVYLLNTDGSLVQELTGDESGFATAWANDTKSLAYGVSPDGLPTLVIADFVERRLDVYQVPEPATLGLLGLGGLAMLRRKAGMTDL